MSNFAELNGAQREAVEATEGPVLVLAGAGAGKTKTITYRILNLIKKGVAPENILAVTFTNKAAKEMGERVLKLLENERGYASDMATSGAGRPFVATYHGLGAFIIKENAREAGVKKHFSIYDREDSKRAVKEALQKNGYDPKQFEPAKILSIISREKGNFVSSSEYVERASGDYFGNIVAKVWQDYEIILKKENALDFDDLLLVAAKLLQNESIRKFYGERWKYIHIDEYQDTNKVQYKIVDAIARDRQNICAVGDVDQNIYTWRNASIKNILEVANKIIEKNKLRMERKLTTKNAVGEKVGLFEALTENHEAQFVVEKVRELQKSGADLSEIAVLYRANFQSRVLEEEFLVKNIPYQVLGTRFFDRKEIKDI